MKVLCRFLSPIENKKISNAYTHSHDIGIDMNTYNAKKIRGFIPLDVIDVQNGGICG